MDYSKLEALVKMLKSNDDLCGICHLSNNNSSVKLPCKHKYHMECINNYVLKKKLKSGTCPYCNKKFFKNNIIIKKCPINLTTNVKKCTICKDHVKK